MRDTLIAGVLAVLIIGAGILFFIQDNTNASPSEEITNISKEVPFTEIAQGTQSTITTPTNYLITSESQFNELLQIVDTKEKIPTVDFNKSYVAAVFAGERPTDGYAIKVSKIEDANVRIVTVTVIEPGSKCTKKSSATAPFALIELPKTSLKFTHQREVITADCVN